MEEGIVVTEGSAADMDTLMLHREKLWLEVSTRGVEAVSAALEPYREWLLQMLRDGSVVAFIACSGGSVAGSGCLWMREMHPRPGRSRNTEVYLLGMYTEPAYRRMKVGSRILARAVEWCRSNGFGRIVLHASEQGAKLYKTFGFEETTEMKLDIA